TVCNKTVSGNRVLFRDKIPPSSRNRTRPHGRGGIVGEIRRRFRRWREVRAATRLAATEKGPRSTQGSPNYHVVTFFQRLIATILVAKFDPLAATSYRSSPPVH